ncbi:MAG: hypothetical protein ACLP9C_06150 [Acidimicrobiales bacterium]
MPNLRTTVTELVTGLGMLGHSSVDAALAERPAQMVSVSPEMWDQLGAVRAGGAFDDAFDAAFENGTAFLASPGALRGRPPLSIEWKGSGRAPGDEVAPVDLRVDHVYLVSCKYLSKILFNASPSHLFDGLLAGPHGRRSGDWFAEVAPGAHEELYRRVRQGVGLAGLPADAASLSTGDRRRLRVALARGWPDGAEPAYVALTRAVSAASAARWTGALGAGDREAMFWRLVRMGSAPYFVLGRAAGRPLRLRVATPWDWRLRFRLEALDIEPQPGGQPRVGWQARVRDKDTGRPLAVAGHVEVRWSHGRFGAPPEAKVYLDVAHHEVPGYFPLDAESVAQEPDGRGPAAGDRPRGGRTGPTVGTEPLRLFGADEEPARPD